MPSSPSRSERRPRLRGAGPRLVPLGLPRRIRVQVDDAERPVAVHGRRHWVPVLAVREAWRIDDEWWRAPLSRDYFDLVLEGGRPVRIFRDRIEGGWYLQ